MCSKFERIISTIYVYYKRCHLFPSHILTGQPRNHSSISGRSNVCRPVLELTQRDTTGSASMDCSNVEANRVCRCECLRNKTANCTVLSSHSSRTALKLDVALSSLMIAYISKLPRLISQKTGIFMRTALRMPTLARWNSLWEWRSSTTQAVWMLRWHKGWRPS